MTAPFTEVPVSVRKRFWAERYISRLEAVMDALKAETNADAEFMTTPLRGANRIVIKDIEIMIAMARQQLEKAYAESGASDGQ